jgi:hypothetical protein
VRLRAVVEGRLGGVALLDHDVGLPEAGRDVAALVYLHLAGDVASLVDLRGVRPERRLRIDDERVRLVLHLDQADVVLGRLLGVGGHRRDLLADVADDVREEDRVLEPGDVRGFGAAQDGPHAPERLGLRRVDPPDAGVRVGAAQHPGVELAGQPNVVGVLGAAGHLQVALDARDRLADDLEVGVRGPGRGHLLLYDGVLLLAVPRLLALDVQDGHGRPPAIGVAVGDAAGTVACSSAARCPARTMFW